jgi:hypothetical protein
MTTIFKIPEYFRVHWNDLKKMPGQVKQCKPKGGAAICIKDFLYNSHKFKQLGFYIFLDFHDASMTGPKKRYFVYIMMNPNKNNRILKNGISISCSDDFLGAWIDEQDFKKHFRVV